MPHVTWLKAKSSETIYPFFPLKYCARVNHLRDFPLFFLRLPLCPQSMRDVRRQRVRIVTETFMFEDALKRISRSHWYNNCTLGINVSHDILNARVELFSLFYFCPRTRNCTVIVPLIMTWLLPDYREWYKTKLRDYKNYNTGGKKLSCFIILLKI